MVGLLLGGGREAVVGDGAGCIVLVRKSWSMWEEVQDTILIVRREKYSDLPPLAVQLPEAKQDVAPSDSVCCIPGVQLIS